ncbi:MAG: hypothetical protein QOI29_2816 [Mycobacterium sp.]|nr:hypothetical protein [Mycobacterium sp.]
MLAHRQRDGGHQEDEPPDRHRLIALPEMGLVGTVETRPPRRRARRWAGPRQRGSARPTIDTFGAVSITGAPSALTAQEPWTASAMSTQSSADGGVNVATAAGAVPAAVASPVRGSNHHRRAMSSASTDRSTSKAAPSGL